MQIQLQLWTSFLFLWGNHTKTVSMFVSQSVICHRCMLPAAWYLITCVIKWPLCSLLLLYLPYFQLWVCVALITRDYFLYTWHVCICKYVGNIVCAQVHRLLIRCLQALNSKCLCQLRLKNPVQAWENTSFNVWMKLWSGIIYIHNSSVMRTETDVKWMIFLLKKKGITLYTYIFIISAALILLFLHRFLRIPEGTWHHSDQQLNKLGSQPSPQLNTKQVRIFITISFIFTLEKVIAHPPCWSVHSFPPQWCTPNNFFPPCRQQLLMHLYFHPNSHCFSSATTSTLCQSVHLPEGYIDLLIQWLLLYVFPFIRQSLKGQAAGPVSAKVMSGKQKSDVCLSYLEMKICYYVDRRKLKSAFYQLKWKIMEELISVCIIKSWFCMF